MKTLILMRHAKSDWSGDGLADFDRPLNPRGRRSAAALGDWLRAEALAEAHAIGLIHRDIKPSNIMLCRQGGRSDVVKLLDFGVVRDLNDQNPPDNRRILGDPFYMPPEQTYAGGPLDTRADLYALGMTFFEVITGGRHPFEDLFSEHPREALRAQRDRAPVLPSTYLPADTPAERASGIDAVFQMAVGKSPEERFQTAKAMQRALDSID